MSVLSFRFVAFVAGAVLIYYLTPGKHQWKVLLLLSYAFYMLADVRAVIFILVTSLSTFYAGKMIGRINDEFEVAVASYQGPNPKMTRDEKKALKAEEDRRKRVIMIAVLLLNFGILIALKYVGVLAKGVNFLCRILNRGYRMSGRSILVPLGISYYTFQSMGYVIDLYRRKFQPEKNLARLMLFVSFFPQLIQGPISRYDEFADQLYAEHRFSYTRVKHGIELSVWGLFKKLVISDRIAILTSTIFSSPEIYGGWYLVLATCFSMLQLYTDFSGGIDILRGVSETFGVVMPENFTRPFFSENQGEYWRRWHITLNNWWRDYIFYPLTLSKPLVSFSKIAKKIFGNDFGKKLPILVSVIIIRVINSIWHGATTVSILGGVYYGLLLAFSFYFETKFKRLNELLHINTECLSFKVFRCVRTFILICVPRLVVNATSLKDAGRYIHYLFSIRNPWILFDGSLYNLGVSQKEYYVVIFSLLFLLVISLVQEKGIVIRDLLDKQNILFRGLIYIVFIYVIILFGAYGAGYDASAFIYQQI